MISCCTLAEKPAANKEKGQRPGLAFFFSGTPSVE
jgi:hypothetical protein